MPIDGYSLSSIQQFVSRELGVSDWLTIDQDRIDGFAAYTDDHQWIHVDVERARRESPFGSPIAHGYLLLALLPRFFYEVGVIPPGRAPGDQLRSRARAFRGTGSRRLPHPEQNSGAESR